MRVEQAQSFGDRVATMDERPHSILDPVHGLIRLTDDEFSLVQSGGSLRARTCRDFLVRTDQAQRFRVALWVVAAAHRQDNLRPLGKRLRDVLEILPRLWRQIRDARLEGHFAEFPVAPGLAVGETDRCRRRASDC